MCYLRLTIYTCSHISPIHPPHYQPPTATDPDQANPNTEWPTHKDTACEACYDASRRGIRCPEPLGKMEVVYREGKGKCDECREKQFEEESA